MSSQPLVFKALVTPSDPLAVCDFLAAKTPLSKIKAKRAIEFGAVWQRQPKRKAYRVRRVTRHLNPGDEVAIYYDEHILQQPFVAAGCLRRFKRYSVWYKPAGVLSEGTRYGDRGALLRQAEQHLGPRQRVHLVHRLDREADGLVLIAHDREAAAQLSALFQKRKVRKRYQVVVWGYLGAPKHRGAITAALDDKAAVTDYEVVDYNRDSNTSVVSAQPKTGRYHQIRRHFDLIGHPVMGDPLYGSGNKNSEGMRLTATGLEFLCPFSRQAMALELDGQGNLKVFMTDRLPPG